MTPFILYSENRGPLSAGSPAQVSSTIPLLASVENARDVFSKASDAASNIKQRVLFIRGSLWQRVDGEWLVALMAVGNCSAVGPGKDCNLVWSSPGRWAAADRSPWRSPASLARRCRSSQA